MADWTNLPAELMERFSEFITLYADYINVRAMSREWQRMLPQIPTHLPPQFPWLMVPDNFTDQPRRFFLDFSSNQFFSIHLPQTSFGNRHCGSSHGWLIIMKETSDILMVNPFNRAMVPLPHISSFTGILSFNLTRTGHEYEVVDRLGYGSIFCSLEEIVDQYIKKIILSSNPEDCNFVAVAIYGENRRLAYTGRHGCSPWRITGDDFSDFEDVIHYEGLFYAVNRDGRIAVCDFIERDDGQPYTVTILDVQTPQDMHGDRLYLIGSGDGLTILSRYLEHDGVTHQRTVRFEVYKLDWGETEWERVTNLGDQVFFVGQNESMALSALGASGFMGNCIYYTDDYSEGNYQLGGDYDLGIYKLSDGSIERLGSHLRHTWPVPLWVTPAP